MNFLNHDGWEVFVILGGCTLNWKIVLMQKEVAVVWGGDGKYTSTSNVKALFQYEDDGKTSPIPSEF